MRKSVLKQFNISMLCILVLLTTHISAQSAQAEEASTGAWKFSAGAYAWAPAIKGKTAQGGDIDISLSDIIDNLDITFMAVMSARKDKFSLLVDVVYMDLNDNSNYTFSGPRDIVSLSLTNLEMESWVVTPAASYTVVDSNHLIFDLLVGARYLYLSTDVDLEERGPLTTRKFSVSGSNHVWDGIVGARGNIKVNEQWTMPFHFDVGTGDTDLTWQAFAGVEYKFTNVSLVAGYRHLEWDFDDKDTGGDLFDDLYISGPVIGFRYFF